MAFLSDLARFSQSIRAQQEQQKALSASSFLPVASCWFGSTKHVIQKLLHYVMQ
jgi:hypothetical protein